jgi:AcrR family transcriptional regulator
MTAVVPVRRRRLSRRDREQQLLAVAEEVFASVGVQAASMDEIAERAGISKPVVYDHFGSKDGLLAAVVESIGERLHEVTLAATATAPTPERALSAGLTAYFEFAEAHAGKWRTMMRETTASSAAAQALEGIRFRQASMIAQVLATDLSPGPRERAMILAQAIIGASERVATYRSLLPAGSAPSIPDSTAGVMDLVWTGLQAQRLAHGVLPIPSP